MKIWIRIHLPTYGYIHFITLFLHKKNKHVSNRYGESGGGNGCVSVAAWSEWGGGESSRTSTPGYRPTPRNPAKNYALYSDRSSVDVSAVGREIKYSYHRASRYLD